MPEEKTRHALTAGLLRLHEDVDRLSPARVPPLHVHHHPRKRADSTFALTSPVRPRHFLTGDTCTHARRCLPDLWQISGKGRAEQRRIRHDSIGDRSLARRVASAHARALRALVEADEEAGSQSQTWCCYRLVLEPAVALRAVARAAAAGGGSSAAGRGPSGAAGGIQLQLVAGAPRESAGVWGRQPPGLTPGV